MQLELEGKKIAVTGASSGIGRAIAERALEAGALILAMARRNEALQELATRYGRARVVTLAVDVTSDDAPEKMVRAVAREWGVLDGLVNAAGILVRKTVEAVPFAEFESMMRTNFYSAFRLIQASVSLLRQSRGAIVNVSSLASLRPLPGLGPYGVIKAALDHLTRVCAFELAPDGIRVNAVNPGLVTTDLFESAGMDAKAVEAFFAEARKAYPLGRLGRPEEIADVVVFLLSSSRAGWITGQTLGIDGGRAFT